MSPTPRQRHAFTLLETIVVIVSLGIAVPPTVAWLDRAAARRADAVNALRASAMATAIVEHVVADTASAAPGLGFAALEQPATYLATPTTGLYSRLNTPLSIYTTMGMSYTVTIGPLVDSTMAVNADTSQNLFRVVQTTVTYPSAEGGVQQIEVAVVVTDL